MREKVQKVFRRTAKKKKVPTEGETARARAFGRKRIMRRLSNSLKLGVEREKSKKIKKKRRVKIRRIPKKRETETLGKIAE